MYKDFRGMEIVEGDTVAYVSGGRYTNRYTAKVVGFTRKMVKIVSLNESQWQPAKITVNPDCCWVLDRKPE